MLFSYPIAALFREQHERLELAVSAGLLVLGAIGLATTPIFIIAAIALHGAWDFAKHQGLGIPFFGWYTLGCAAFDWVYAAALLVFFFNM